MGAPYITEAKAAKIAKQLIEENKPEPTPVPESGTKLYKHTIVDDNSLYNIECISNDGVPIEDAGEIIDLIRHSINVRQVNKNSTSGNFTQFLAFDSDSRTLYFNDFDSLIELPVADIDFASDTVTEL